MLFTLLVSSSLTIIQINSPDKIVQLSQGNQNLEIEIFNWNWYRYIDRIIHWDLVKKYNFYSDLIIFFIFCLLISALKRPFLTAYIYIYPYFTKFWEMKPTFNLLFNSTISILYTVTCNSQQHFHFIITIQSL